MKFDLEEINGLPVGTFDSLEEASAAAESMEVYAVWTSDGQDLAEIVNGEEPFKLVSDELTTTRNSKDELLDLIKRHNLTNTTILEK